MATATGPKGIDWDAERTTYVTGNETFDEVAVRLGVNVKTLERMASRAHPLNLGETWGEKRAAYRATAAIVAQQRTTSVVAETLARVRDKAASVAEKALLVLEERIDDRVDIDRGEHGWESCPLQAKDLIAAAKLATAVKIEFGGDPNGVPVKIARTLDDLDTDALLKIAGEK